jgi:hypothetical protein
MFNLIFCGGKMKLTTGDKLWCIEYILTQGYSEDVKKDTRTLLRLRKKYWEERASKKLNEVGNNLNN